MKTHLENTNNRLDKISQEVIEITKSLEFTHGQIDEELTTMKNDWKTSSRYKGLG